MPLFGKMRRAAPADDIVVSAGQPGAGMAAPAHRRNRMAGIFGGLNRFGQEFLEPTTWLGRLGAYIGAAAGSPIGEASIAAMRDRQRMDELNAEAEYRRAMAQAALTRAAQPNTAPDRRFFQRRDGSIVAIDPVTLEETLVSGPVSAAERLVRVADPNSHTGERLVPVSEAAGRPVGRVPAAAGGGGGSGPRTPPRYIRAPDGRLMKWVP